jgi:hypothetical protein
VRGAGQVFLICPSTGSFACLGRLHPKPQQQEPTKHYRIVIRPLVEGNVTARNVRWAFFCSGCFALGTNRAFSVQQHGRPATCRSDTMTTEKAIWFVSFAVRAPDATHQRYQRQTRTFASEREAKAFAASLLDRTDDISAGTINPHSPRRVIAPAAIMDWVGDH